MSPTRREFLGAGVASGAALLIGVARNGRVFGLSTAPAHTLAPSQWLRIETSGDVIVVAHQSEMGQGVRTSLPLIVAAELGADWSRVRVEHAHPGPDFPDMGTGGSGSVRGAWLPLRRAAAAAREMLVSAAANDWGVGAAECRTEKGEVVHAPSGKRAAFGTLVARATALPVPNEPTLHDEGDLALLGGRPRRVDGPAIVTGKAVYGIDVRVPGMRFAALARPPVAGASPSRWSEAAALSIHGVQRVVRLGSRLAVVATDSWAAFRGRDALAVEWTGDSAKEDNGNDATYERVLTDSLEHGKVARRVGAPQEAMSQASRTPDATYFAPFQAHMAMEPLSCTADVRLNSCEIWVGTQSPNDAQKEAAAILGVSPERVKVNVALLGGGFGRRLAVDYVVEAVELARAIAAPVQVVWSREDDVRHDMFNAMQVNRISAGVDASGRVTAWRHRVADFHLSMFGAFNPNADPSADGDPWGAYDTPYAFSAWEATLAQLEAPVATGAWRAVTYPAAVFARESFLDEVAHATGRDPVAARLELLDLPDMVKLRGGASMDNRARLAAVLRLVAERSGWGTAQPNAPKGRRWGRGVACNLYHRSTAVAQVAEVSVGETGDIQVHRVVCAVECGRVIDRSGLEAQFEGGVMWALSAALKTRINFERGRAVQGNFDNVPVLRLREAPKVKVHVAPSALPPFGVGEMGVPAVAAAVANAVFAATGERLRRLPLRVGGES
ncbi:MAG: molybdopterin cofactor-binding domain-containing protein, partial [Gemmatimonadaceae bacterium]